MPAWTWSWTWAWAWTEEAIQAAIAADKAMLDAVEARFLPRLQAELAALGTPALVRLCHELKAGLEAADEAKRERSAGMSLSDRLGRLIELTKAAPEVFEADYAETKRLEAEQWYTGWVFDQVLNTIEQRRKH